jgi:ketopantoate hydroxymethyltransferase
MLFATERKPGLERIGRVPLAAREYAGEVRQGRFPAAEHTYSR